MSKAGVKNINNVPRLVMGVASYFSKGAGVFYPNFGWGRDHARERSDQTRGRDAREGGVFVISFKIMQSGAYFGREVTAPPPLL